MPHRIADKLSFLLLVSVSSLLFDWWVNLLTMGALYVLHIRSRTFRPSSVLNTRRFRSFQLLLVPLVVLMILVNGLLTHEGPVVTSLGPFSLYLGGFMFGVRTGLRLMVLTTAMLLVFSSTPLRVFARFLGSVGLPSPIVMSILLTLTYLDQLPRRIETIFTAQEARGAPVRAGMYSRFISFFAILTPLVLSSIAESVERGSALELRGFHSRTKLSLPAQRYEVAGRSWLTPLFLWTTGALLAGILLRWLLT